MKKRRSLYGGNHRWYFEETLHCELCRKFKTRVWMKLWQLEPKDRQDIRLLLSETKWY